MRRDVKEIALGARRLNGREKLRVTINTFNGRTYIHARRWYLGHNGTFLPGKGLSLSEAELTWVWKRLRAADRRLRLVGRC